MNKKLVAVAVAGVLAAPLAAQAQTANVTLYGRLNIDYELVNGRQADGSNPNVIAAGCELVASGRSRHGIVGRRPERNFPDRIRRSRRHQRGGGFATS